MDIDTEPKVAEIFRKKKIALAVPVLATVVVLLLCFTTRIVPQPDSDRGIYISVAERLLAGDRLYRDVYDNKDPLFYYLIAGERFAGPIHEYLAEFILIIATGILCSEMSRYAGSTSPIRYLVVFNLAIVLVTGAHYDIGGTFPVGIFLSMLAIYFSTRKKIVCAGALISVLFFTKLILVPVVALFFVVQQAHLAGWRLHAALLRLFQLGCGVIVAAVPILLVLHSRGELGPYIDVQIENFRYSSNNMVTSQGLFSNLGNHLLATAYFGWGTLAFAVVVLIRLIFLSPANEVQRSLRWACIAIFPISLVLLSLIVIWSIHVSIAYIFLLTSISTIAGSFKMDMKDVISLCFALGLSPWLIPNPEVGNLARNPLYIGERIKALATLSPETKAFREEVHQRSGNYARIGTNNDFHHAMGMRAFTLKCRNFHQYAFYSEALLNQIVDCAEDADFLIVNIRNNEMSPDDQWIPRNADFRTLNSRWQNHYLNANAMIARSFTCSGESDGIRICRNLRRTGDR